MEPMFSYQEVEEAGRTRSPAVEAWSSRAYRDLTLVWGRQAVAVAGC
jgi:hypothetical protein